MPLAYLGEEIGLPKLAMPDNNDLSAEWSVYAKRDVEIIMTACIKWWQFLESNDMGNFASTLAGQAMNVYRHKYMKIPIFLDNNDKALALTRQGYYGGRVECFRVGRYDGDFYALDVNSMYPSVMQANPFPRKLIAHTRYANLTDLRNWLKRYSVTARVLLRTSIPFAPYRTKDKLIFPTGEFETILSTPELQYALDHAEILELLEVAVYEHDYLFTEFMNDMTTRKSQAKQSGNTVEEHQYKKLINSFYGKWGQSGGKWAEHEYTDDLTCKRWKELDLETGTIIHHRQLGGLIQSKENAGESRDSFPAIAAHVTAYARMNLWRIIEKAGHRNVFYTDTDCVWTNEAGYQALSDEIDPYRLGALKLDKRCNTMELWGAKDYRFGMISKTKGVRKKAVWLDDHKIMQEQWSGLRGLVASGDVTAPRTKTIVKNLKRVYEKGLVTAEGWVIPHRLIHQFGAPKPQAPLDVDAYLVSELLR